MGITTGASALDFIDMKIALGNNGSSTYSFFGGIYDNSSGHPGTELFAFTPVNVGLGASIQTMVSPGATLAANTSYWFLIKSNDATNFDVTWQRNGASSAPVATGVTYNGYSGSNNAGGSWFTPVVQHALEIRASVGASAPEPGTLMFLAVGGTLVLIKRRRS